MNQHKPNRRKFLNAVTATTMGGILANTLSPFTSQAQTHTSSAIEDNSEYLLEPGLVYLNSGTIGPCRRETLEASIAVNKELELLPLRYYGKWGAESLGEKTRTTASQWLGCDLNEIMISSSTTFGMNALAQGLRLKSGDHIVTTDQEHGGGLLCWEYYQKYCGVKLDIITIPPGENDAAAILNRINSTIKKETRLISVSHIFSSTGLRMPVKEIAALARSKNILCIVDGAQAVGAVDVNLKDLGCHAYATSGHKWLMGPKGTGLLYISKDAQDLIRPMQFESNHNTYNDSNGVVNQAAILGLNAAIEYLRKIGMSNVEKHNLALRNKLYQLMSNVKDFKLVSPPPGPLASPMLAGIIPVRIDRTEFVHKLLDKHKLSIRPTHKQWFNGIRFSMHIFNTQKEVDFAADVVSKELI